MAAKAVTATPELDVAPPAARVVAVAVVSRGRGAPGRAALPAMLAPVADRHLPDRP